MAKVTKQRVETTSYVVELSEAEAEYVYSALSFVEPDQQQFGEKPWGGHVDPVFDALHGVLPHGKDSGAKLL